MATNYDKLLDKIRELGMDFRWARMFVKKLRDDETAFPVIDNDQKRWALERGFFPGRIELFDLTEDNYRSFVPDYQYFMLHPMNNHFLKWLDKTTLKYVLNSNGCEDIMPEYYVYVENEQCGGRFTYLMNCPKEIPRNKDFLWNLLQQKRILAMKPNSGTSGGLGFIKLELRNDVLYENNKRIDIVRFEEIRDTMRNYIITEYAYQHHELAKIWPDSECTLRIIMCKNPTDDRYAPTSWSNVVSYARFGTSLNGGASNLSAGGIGIGFDYETGKYQDFSIQYKRFASNGSWKIDRHPDTGVEWRSLGLPNWQLAKKKINGLCQHISSLDYMGLDIIITEDGIKLCEINSHPALDYEQVLSGPALSKKNVKSFFEHKGLMMHDGKDFYRAYIESQE